MFKDKRTFIEYMIIFCIGIFLSAIAIMKFDDILSSIGKLLGILKPFYIGFAIAYILNRPISFFERKLKIKRSLSILMVYIGVIGIITTFVIILLPSIIESSIRLVNELSKNANRIPETLSFISSEPLKALVENNLSRLTDLLGSVTNFLINNVTKIFMSVTSTLLNIIFAIVISVYMLLDKEKIKKLFSNIIDILIKEERSSKIHDFLTEVNLIFSHFITGLLIEATIIGTLAFIGMTILGVKYAPILGLIICFTNVIPYVGPFIGAIPAVVATLMYNPMLAFWVMIYILILQQLDGNYIGPKVMGNYIGLEPIWIILSITIGGGFLGILGILLAIPTGAIVKIILTGLLKKKVDKNMA
ncbi:MAG: AI-2E family transporter [Acidaminobacteraceae bacterium]